MQLPLHHQQRQQQQPTLALLQTTSQPQPTGHRVASQQQQQRQQQQALHLGLLLEGDGGEPHVLPGPQQRQAQQQALPPMQKQQQLAAAVVTATAVSADAATAAAAAEGCDEDMAQCGPLQLEDSGFSSQHTLTGLELTASEAAFAEEHSSTARPAWQQHAQHALHKQHPPAAGAYHQQQQAGAVAASAMPRCGVLPGTHGVPQSQLTGLTSSAAPTAVGGGVLQPAGVHHADATAEAAGFCARQFLAMSGVAPVGVGGLPSPPGSTGGYDPTLAAAAAAGTGFGAGAVAVGQQQQQQGSMQGCRGDDDLRSSFGDFGCLQDLQNILDTC